MEYGNTENPNLVITQNITVTRDPGEALSPSELMAMYAEDNTLNLVFFCITLLELVFGTVGNLLVIAAVLINKKLRKIHNVFVVNLAVSDLCISAFLNTVNLVSIHYHGEFLLTYGALCQFIGCLCFVSCTTSFFSIAGIALNRYICICHNPVYHTIFTKRITSLLILLIWVVAFSSNWLPFIVDGSENLIVPEAFTCMNSPTSSYGFIGFGIGFGIVIALIIYCYLRIWFYVRASKKALQKFGAGNRRAVPLTNTDKRLLRSLVTLVLSVLIMTTPFTLIYTASLPVARVSFVITFAMVHLNSCVNCVIYALTNSDFRQGYCDVLARCCQNCRFSKLRKKKTEIYVVTEHARAPRKLVLIPRHSSKGSNYI